MSPLPFGRSLIPFLLIAAFAPVHAAWGNVCQGLAFIDLPDPVFAGKATVNLGSVRYALYAMDDPGDACERLKARIDRHLEAGLALRAQTPAGPLRIAVSGGGSKTVLLASLGGKRGWIAVALLESGLALDAPDGKRDLPGRDPAGWPRLRLLRRMLHVAGDGFEAALYRGRENPGRMIESARTGFASAGWRILAVTGNSLSALNQKGQGVAIFARSEGIQTDLLVFAPRDGQ